jgi:hypothetical protein
MMLRGAAYALPTWAHLTSGTGSSSSRGWPTLLAADARRTSSGPRRDGGQSLADAVLWATPKASDTRSGRVSEEVFTRNSRPLSEQVEFGTAPGMRLNPEWLEALMGFPAGWTKAASTA